MTSAHDALSDLEALAYEAALEPSLWPQVVADASRAFKAPYMMLGVVDRRGKTVMHAAPPDLDELAEVMMARYPTFETNPGLAFAALTPPTAVGLRDRIVSDSDLERLDFYQDILRPLGLWHAAIMNVHRDDAVLAPMAFMRARKEGPFGDGEVAALRALAPHFNRALRVTLRLRELEARASALAEMTDRALVALVLTDAFGRVAEANGVARAILAENDGLILRDGVLRAARSEDCIRLSRLIQEAAGSRLMPMSGVMQVARPSSRRPLALVVSPTRAAGSPFGRSHAVSIAFADPRARAGIQRGPARATLWLHRPRGGRRGAFAAGPFAERGRGRARDDRKHGPHPHPPPVRQDRRRTPGRPRTPSHAGAGR